jgi:hypothetical protein
MLELVATIPSSPFGAWVMVLDMKPRSIWWIPLWPHGKEGRAVATYFYTLKSGTFPSSMTLGNGRSSRL